MKRIIIAALLLTSLFPQPEAGATFLLISPSPRMNGFGEGGVSLPSDDPYSSYYNPANGVNAGKGIFYSKADKSGPWLPNLASLTFNYNVKSIGLFPEQYPFQLSITNHKELLDLGEQIRTDEYGHVIDIFHVSMSMNGWTIGANYRYNYKWIPFDISVGMTKKHIKEDLTGTAISEKDLTDYGALIAFPFNSGYFNFRPLGQHKIGYEIRPSFGYSISNLADSIIFKSDWEHADGNPAPRLARIGLSTRLSLTFDGKPLLQWSGEHMASDLLIRSDSAGFEYQNGIGEIQFYRNVIRSKPDSSLFVNRGDEWTFLGFYTWRSGHYTDINGQLNFRTTGYSWRLSGLLNLLYYVTKEPVYQNLKRYLDVRYDYAIWHESPGGPVDHTEFESWTITVNNIDKLIVKLLK